MVSGEDQELLLGRHTPVLQEYAPQILYPIPRHLARQNLGLSDALPFQGVDLWHAYESVSYTHLTLPTTPYV